MSKIIAGIVVGWQRQAHLLFDQRQLRHIKVVPPDSPDEARGYSASTRWACVADVGDVKEMLLAHLQHRHGGPISIEEMQRLATKCADAYDLDMALRSVTVDELHDGAVLIRTAEGNLVLPRLQAVALRSRLASWGGTA